MKNIALKNNLTIFERVNKLSRKNKCIWGKLYFWTWRHLDYKFWLHYILLDFDWKSFGQWFIIWIMLHFTGFGLEIFWTKVYNYTYYKLYWRWTWKYLHYKYGLRDLDLNILWPRILVTIIRFSLDLYLEILGLWFRIMIDLMSPKKYEEILDLSIKNITNYLSVCDFNTSSRKVELVVQCSRVFSLRNFQTESSKCYPKSCPKANSILKSAISGYFIKINIQ